MTSVKVAAIVASLFGILTVLSGARALFGGANMGSVVPFVLWFNFLAGFAYVIAGVGLWKLQNWAATLSILIAATTLVVALAFAIHVLSGLPYEPRTAAALMLRFGVWLWIARVSRPLFRP